MKHLSILNYSSLMSKFVTLFSLIKKEADYKNK
ncbi:hypothetical protein AB837_00533 [bacterium AB1]|nr:hypothetical protein AB837_00533 [bacterium AB1]